MSHYHYSKHIENQRDANEGKFILLITAVLYDTFEILETCLYFMSSCINSTQEPFMSTYYSATLIKVNTFTFHACNKISVIFEGQFLYTYRMEL